ncbi:ATP-grasp domain-containing protein [Jidongwangia harbinensis]|uniref:preATP grasp domain-containing protein n=1 Tax=Jidongwangia harbinensis TaxID=2878561 RepID=UPI001CDA1D2D|nr:ATP-grasp domain-containing protein [Jidongwangia harbinensis]MCA2211344.1 ATP-grasp domain-containing protein [Jidongwangia harbinensis]
MRDFLDRLRESLLTDRAAPMVVVGNFEVERQWAAGEPGLPGTGLTTSTAVVHRMDEFALFLAGEKDHVLVKAPPDPDFLSYLCELGVDPPQVLSPAAPEPHRVVTADALADPRLLDRLRQLSPAGAQLVPHGVSALEEDLARACGLPLAGSPAAVCKAVNSKIYSRRLADALGLPQPTGWTCENLADWAAACRYARPLVADGVTVAVKEAFGVSGKGILIVADAARLDQVSRKFARRAERTGDDRLAVVVEFWVDRRTDLNYQVTVGADGAVRFDFVKEAVTDGGVHRGHRFPPDLTGGQESVLRDAGEAIGRRLAADGYRGVAGIDALITEDGRLFPVIEINARNNMSTYQLRLEELLGAGRRALARHHPVRLAARVPFGTLRRELGGLLHTRHGDGGVVVHNFATLNAAAAATEGAGPFDGRLYVLLLADSEARLRALDRELARRLAVLGEAAER